MSTWIGRAPGGQSGDGDVERANDLGRGISIPARDGERATRREMAEVIGHRLLGVEVAFGQRVGAARERGEAVDHRHHHQVVAVAAAADEAARLVFDQPHPRVEIDRAAVGGVAPAHEVDDRTVDLDSGDRSRSVPKRCEHVDAATGADHQHARARGDLVRRAEDARVEHAEVARRGHPEDRRERAHVELHRERRRSLRRRVVPIDEEAVVDRIAALSKPHDVDPREWVPSRGVTRHALGEIGARRLERAGSRRREHLAPEREDHDEADRGGHGREAAQSKTRGRRSEEARGDEAEPARESVERLVTDRPDRDVADDPAGRGTRKVERVDRSP